ncbi:hypothetical protein DXG03_007655 [Asterophora parasitica]|uniref:Uncharacterized protein n=1 Tax=Asterophora parasitica TaxID=117018 RepID=A0A9P7G235_9AGAR|nr:hypothetical protein DXG03_007655 [Asterophora parasitica]
MWRSPGVCMISKTVKEILYLTDSAPEGLHNSLRSFPYATRLGLTASSTPFTTGRPFTLFHNSRIYSSGGVGLALLRSPYTYHDPLAHTPATVRPSFPGLNPLGQPMRVSQSEGNMINSLDSSNPTKLLLREVDGTPHLWADSDSPSYFLGTLRGESVQEMYSITAGDPSRGSLSLGSSRAPDVGSLVQFFHLPPTTPTEFSLPPPTHSPTQKLTLLCTPPSPSPTLPDPDCDPATVHVLSGRFISASENGFVLARGRALPPPVKVLKVDASAKTQKGKGKKGVKEVEVKEKERLEKEKKDKEKLEEQEKDATAWTCTVPGGTVDLVWGAST